MGATASVAKKAGDLVKDSRYSSYIAEENEDQNNIETECNVPEQKKHSENHLSASKTPEPQTTQTMPLTSDQTGTFNLHTQKSIILDGEVENYTSQQLTHALTSKGSVYDRYQAKFVEHGVDGSMISKLDEKGTEELLERIGIDNTLQRKLMVYRIRGLVSGNAERTIRYTDRQGADGESDREGGGVEGGGGSGARRGGGGGGRRSVRRHLADLHQLFRASLPMGCVWAMSEEQVADRLAQPEVAEFLGVDARRRPRGGGGASAGAGGPPTAAAPAPALPAVDGLGLLLLTPAALARHRVPFALRTRLWELLLGHGWVWHNLCLESLRQTGAAQELANQAAVVPPALLDYQWEQTISKTDRGIVMLVWSVHSGQLLVAQLVQLGGEDSSHGGDAAGGNGGSGGGATPIDAREQRRRRGRHLHALRELPKLRRLVAVGAAAAATAEGGGGGGGGCCLARPPPFESWGTGALTNGTGYFWLLWPYYEGGNLGNYLDHGGERSGGVGGLGGVAGGGGGGGARGARGGGGGGGGGAPLLRCDRRLFWKWARQLARGVAELHAGGMVHLDLRPETVLMTAGLDARIGGVGLAGLGGEAEGSSTSDVYAAPELIGNSFQDFRTSVNAQAADIWSLGVIYFEMCAGAVPDLLGAEEALGAAERDDPRAVQLVRAARKRSPAARPTAPQLAQLADRLAEEALADGGDLAPDPAGSFRLYQRRLERQLPPYKNHFRDAEAAELSAGAPRLLRVARPQGAPIFERASKHLRHRGEVTLPQGLVVRATGRRCLGPAPRPSSRAAPEEEEGEGGGAGGVVGAAAAAGGGAGGRVEYWELAPSYWVEAGAAPGPAPLEEVAAGGAGGAGDLVTVAAKEGLNIYSHHRVNSALQVGYLPFGTTVALSPERHVELFLGTRRVKLSGQGWATRSRQYPNKEVQHFLIDFREEPTSAQPDGVNLLNAVGGVAPIIADGKHNHAKDVFTAQSSSPSR